MPEESCESGCGCSAEEEGKQEQGKESKDDDALGFLPSCNKCFMQKTCYAYLSILGKQEEFKQMKWVALPFKPEALAGTCKEYRPKTDIVDTTKIDKSKDDDHV